MGIQRHWLAVRRANGKRQVEVFTDAAAPSIMGGWTLSGPYVLEAEQPRGAVSADDLDRLLRDVDAYFAGDHVNAGVVIGQIRSRIKGLASTDTGAVSAGDPDHEAFKAAIIRNNTIHPDDERGAVSPGGEGVVIATQNYVPEERLHATQREVVRLVALFRELGGHGGPLNLLEPSQGERPDPVTAAVELRRIIHAALDEERRYDAQGRPLCFECGRTQSEHPGGIECSPASREENADG